MLSTMINSTHELLVEREARTITLRPVKGHSATMFMLHGLGDTAAGWADAAAHFSASLPHVKFVLPTAAVQPVTLNGGASMHSWYDIRGLKRSDEACDGIEQSRSRICALISDEMCAGIPAANIVLGGFSQGAALSLYTGLQLDRSLGGIVALSGYLPKPVEWRTRVTAAALATPVLICHGEEDPMVRPEWAHDAVASLREAGVSSVNLKLYRGMGHSVSEQETHDVLTWLCRTVGVQAAAAAAATMHADDAAATLRQRASTEAGMASSRLGASVPSPDQLRTGK
jgi:lysophospholipase-2